MASHLCSVAAEVTADVHTERSASHSKSVVRNHAFVTTGALNSLHIKASSVLQ